ncbi:hypothetical protein, partial [Aquisalimonas sp.]|uniref:hypothetical protein n=1 Tax=Aquisalimonas sp. TaxID=1872621 RepID=UPI0025C7027A
MTRINWFALCALFVLAVTLGLGPVAAEDDEEKSKVEKGWESQDAEHRKEGYQPDEKDDWGEQESFELEDEGEGPQEG